MRIEPAWDKLVVKRMEPTEMSEGGIVIPVTAQQPLNMGTVVAVGPVSQELQEKWGRLQTPGAPRKGSTVIFPPFAGNTVTVDDEDVIIIPMEDILATIPSEGTCNCDGKCRVGDCSAPQEAETKK